MHKTRAQQSKTAGQSAQQLKNTKAPDQTDERTTQGTDIPQTTIRTATQTQQEQPVEIPTIDTPSDILDIITADTATISEEGKTIVNSIIKAVQLIIDQKNKKIDQLQSHINQMENRITELENQVDEVNQYERRDTIIVSGPDLPREEHNENCVDVVVRSIKDNLHLNINNTDINVAHRLGVRKSQNDTRPIIVKLQSRQTKYTIMNACVTVRPNLYINESLTPKRSSLFKIVRDIRKQHREKFQQCYTQDGKIVVKLKHSQRKHVITNDADLSQFLDSYPVLKEATNLQV